MVVKLKQVHRLVSEFELVKSAKKYTVIYGDWDLNREAHNREIYLYLYRRQESKKNISFNPKPIAKFWAQKIETPPFNLRKICEKNLKKQTKKNAFFVKNKSN